MTLSQTRVLVAVAFCMLPAAGCVHRQAAGLQTTAHRSAASSSPEFAEKFHAGGISDTGKVNDHLFRGSQPNAEGIHELKKLGVTTIIDLRKERQGTVQIERERAAAAGIKVVNIHASGWSPPTDEELAEFFTVLRKQPRETVYVHCWLGDDRTGVFLAAYRIGFEHWTPERAIDEMYYFHFKGFWHPAMKDFVRNFPARWASSPAFAPFRPETAKAPGSSGG